MKRRQLKTRDSNLAKQTAAWLSGQNISPNMISVASVGFALLAAIAFLQMPIKQWLILAIIGMQGRLLCNLFDGMVAVEGGKQTKSGELFNDMPDRISDVLIFAALGFGIGQPLLGVWACVFAVGTAYTRYLADVAGAKMPFNGPLAKQHRMALLTVFCVIAFFGNVDHLLLVALWIIVIGSAVTILHRVYIANGELEHE